MTSLDKGILNVSQHRGVITFISKKRKKKHYDHSLTGNPYHAIECRLQNS